MCVNTQGSFLCHCRDGYVTERNGTVCGPRKYTINKKMARLSLATLKRTRATLSFFFYHSLVATLCHPGTMNVLMLEVLFSSQGEKKPMCWN